MKNLILEELDCVGDRPVTFKLDPLVFSPRMISDCARDIVGLTADEMGMLTLAGPSPAALDSMKQFCARVLAAKIASL
jgi:hypothetical protein